MTTPDELDQWWKLWKRRPRFALVSLLILGVGFLALTFFSEFSSRLVGSLFDALDEGATTTASERKSWLARTFTVNRDSGGTLKTCEGESCIELEVGAVSRDGSASR